MCEHAYVQTSTILHRIPIYIERVLQTTSFHLWFKLLKQEVINYQKDIKISQMINIILGMLIKRQQKSQTFRNSANFSVSRTQSSEPIHLVIIVLRSGLQNRTHLRGVTPFVLFWNFSGQSCKKILKY